MKTRSLGVAAAVFAVMWMSTASSAQLIAEQEISHTEGNLGPVLSFSDYFGTSVAQLGDIDGDNVADLAVGAEGDDAFAPEAGALYVLFMNGDGTVRTHRKLTGADLPSGGVSAGGYLASSIAGLGDLNGDGVRDVLVGARGNDDTSSGGGESSGAVWVLFLDAGAGVISEQKISETSGGFIGSLDPGDLFGRSVAFLGDVGANGTIEVAVGAPGDDDGGPDRGAVWILSVEPGGLVSSLKKISDGNGLAANVLSDYDGFGTSVTRLRKPDENGILVAVGAPFDDTGGPNRGAAWVIELDPSLNINTTQKHGSGVGGFSGTLADGSMFGRSVAGPGDLNDDGMEDIMVGAPGATASDPHGEFWFEDLVPGTYTVIEPSRLGTGTGGFMGRMEDDDRFAQALAGIGDLDGDNSVDYAVGAPYANDGGDNYGSVYVLFDGKAEPVSIDPELPHEDIFAAPYPNPFSDETVFGVHLAADRHVRIEVYDLLGRLVHTIHDGVLHAGSRHAVPLDARGWPSGTYLYRIVADDYVHVSSLVVAR